MSRKTLKVRKTGKYSVRYGASLKHRALICMESQSKRYECAACGKMALKRKVVGIWKCKACSYTVTGGAYVVKTEGQRAVQLNVQRANKESKK